MRLAAAAIAALLLTGTGSALAQPVRDTAWISQLTILAPADREHLRQRYQEYLGQAGSSDFHLAIAGDGSIWSAAWHEGTDRLTPADLKRMVLQRCQFVAGTECYLAAIDGALKAPLAAPFPLEPQSFQFGGALDAAGIPFIGAADRAAIAASYPAEKPHKALAISRFGPHGQAAGAADAEAAQAAALDACGRSDCFIYAVDDTVVFSADTDISGRRPPSPAQIKAVIGRARDELLRDPRDLVIGNPQGDVTLVEFFDYNCGPCRAFRPVVAEAMQSDPGLRVVLKEYPILGPGSLVASQAALASRRQGKYAAFHEAMMDSRNAMTESRVFGIAASIGLDVERLKADMEAPEIVAQLADNRDLGSTVGADGTPTVIVGDGQVVGGPDLASLRQLIAEARKACPGKC